MNVCWANKKLPQWLKGKKDEELSESKSELKQLKKTITKFRAENQNVQKTEG